MFGLSTDGFLLEEMGPGLILGLHLAVEAILLSCNFILLVLLSLL
jgi:hypothetical protein